MVPVEINDRSMYFRRATEADVLEFIIHLNKVGGINDISRKFPVTCNSYVS